MKNLLGCVLLALTVSATSLVSGRSLQSPVALVNDAATAHAVLPGNYVGPWQGGQDSGELRLKLSRDGAVWSVEATFTFQGELIPTKVSKVKVDGANIELVMAWEVQGTPGKSRMTGQSNGEKIGGSYESETPDGITGGTWNVTRA